VSPPESPDRGDSHKAPQSGDSGGLKGGTLISRKNLLEEKPQLVQLLEEKPQLVPTSRANAPLAVFFLEIMQLVGPLKNTLGRSQFDDDSKSSECIRLHGFS